MHGVHFQRSFHAVAVVRPSLVFLPLFTSAKNMVAGATSNGNWFEVAPFAVTVMFPAPLAAVDGIQNVMRSRPRAGPIASHSA